MLNRRTLRVKALQSLFAYEQSKEADHNVALEMIEQVFEPDLNSMEYQDPVQLKEDRNKAVELFEEYLKTGKSKILKGEDEKIVNAVLDSHNFYRDQIKKDLRNIKKAMVSENLNIYDRYVKVLYLLIRFAEFASEGVGGRKSIGSEQENFSNNFIIQSLKANKELESKALKGNLSWDSESDIVRGWFKDIIYTDKNYQDYVGLKEPSKEEDFEILNHLIRKVIFKNDTFDNYWESEDLNWEENRPIIRSMVIKTIKGINESESNEFELATLSYNWEEDEEFFHELFKKTIENEEFLEDLITKKASNWEFERIAYTDRLILMLAISEMMNFSSIPVKVTINEYIELSKNYSTPKSKQFVNGVLDVIAVDLQDQGLLKKSGRGLIDNK